MQVCNKCGLYERTHLRARPQRFDELRASNKARKNSNAAQSPPSTQSPVSDAKPSPPAQSRLLASPELIKREPGLENGSTSDWDDSLSVYSSSSSAVSSSVYGSPMTSTYSLSGANSPSPTLSTDLPPMPIRVPNAPLTDIMGHGKSFTSPPVPGTPPFWSHGHHHGPVARRHTLAGAEQRWPGPPSASPLYGASTTPTNVNGRPRKGSMS
jgi:GATA-binding protein, other eukaryote